MKVLLLTFKGFLILSVPVFLIIIASDIVIKTRFIYEYDFWRYEISEKTSIELTSLRKIGKEFGATTGRPRRCGWFDIPAAKFSVQVNGLTEIALTKLDVLDEFKEIKVCTGYKIKGIEMSGYSASMCELENVEPIYTTFTGWNTTTVRFHYLENLPGKVKEYIRFLEESLGVPIKLISTGPARDQIIEC